MVDIKHDEPYQKYLTLTYLWIFKVKYKPEYTYLTCRQLANIILFYLFAAYYNQRGEGGGGSFFVFCFG